MKVKDGLFRVRTKWMLTAAIAGWCVGFAHAGAWRDDFDSGSLKDWEIFNLDRAVEAWTVKNREVVGEIDMPNFYSLLILSPQSTNARNWSNYTVRVRATMQDTKNRQDAEPRIGISLYDQEFEENRYLLLLDFAVGEIQIIRATRDFWQVLPFPYALEEAVAYELTGNVTTEGVEEVVTFRVDEMELTVRSNDPFKAGKVGLVVSDGQAIFDDVEVEGASIPNGGTGKPRAVSNRGKAATTWAGLKERSVKGRSE